MFDDGVTWRRGLSGHVLEKRRAGGGSGNARCSPRDAADAVVDGRRRWRAPRTSAMSGARLAMDGPCRRRRRAGGAGAAGLASRFDAAAARADAGPLRPSSTARSASCRPTSTSRSSSRPRKAAPSTPARSATSTTRVTASRRRTSSASTSRRRAELPRRVGQSCDPGASSSARPTRWRCRWRGCCRSSRCCSRRRMRARRGVSAFVDGFTGREEDVGRVPAAEPPRPAPRVCRPRVRPRPAAGVRAKARDRRGRDRDRPGHQGGRRPGRRHRHDRSRRRDGSPSGHERDTVAALNAMGLGAGDLLYFSDLVDVPSTSYPRHGRRRGHPAADRGGAAGQQLARIRAGLRFRGAPPQIAAYDIREFVHYYDHPATCAPQPPRRSDG